MRFLVLANPRSRTRWLSEYLGCGHDLALGCKSVDEFVDRLGTVPGSVETSVAWAWKLWRNLFPVASFVVIHRVPGEVVDSMVRLGLDPDLMFLYLQDLALWQVAEKDKRATLFSFESLVRASSRRALCEWIGVPFSPERDEKLASEHIEVDVATRVADIAANRENIISFNSDVARRAMWVEYAPL